MASGWKSSPQVPFAFGGPIICAYDGDIWTGDIPLALFGVGYVQVLFNLPSAASSVQVSVPALQVGNPTAPLVLTLFNPAGLQVGSVSVPASSVPSGTPNWIPFQTFNGTFAPGYYKLQVSSPSSTSTSYYRGFITFAASWLDPNATGGYHPAPGFQGASGHSVVWVQDSSGNDIVIFPFGDTSVPSSYSTTFVADGSYPVNAFAIIHSDMPFQFKPYSVSCQLQDVTTGTVLGSAPLTQSFNQHGVPAPAQLPSPASLVQGHTYRLSLTGSLNYLFGVLVRASSSNPLKASPTGVSPYWWAKLVYSDFSQVRVLDYANNTILVQNGRDAIGSGNGVDQVGVRFVGTSGTINTVNLKMFSFSVGTNYPAGKPVIVSIFAANDSAPNGSAPTGTALASVTVDSGTIPLNGWFNVPGFNFVMAPGQAYWVVWSSPTSTTGYVPQRCVSPFRQFMQISRNGGTSWQYPGQGPTDLAWYAALAGGSYVGSPFDSTLALKVSTANQVAQPFSLAQAATVNAVSLSGAGGSLLGVVTVSIRPDNGFGGPDMSKVLASGSYDVSISYPRDEYIVPFGANVGSLQAGKYWAIVSGSLATAISGAKYWTRPLDPPIPAGYEVLVSTDGGSSWLPASTQVASALFMVGLQPAGPGPTPTILSLKAAIAP